MQGFRPGSSYHARSGLGLGRYWLAFCWSNISFGSHNIITNIQLYIHKYDEALWQVTGHRSQVTGSRVKVKVKVTRYLCKYVRQAIPTYLFHIFLATTRTIFFFFFLEVKRGTYQLVACVANDMIDIDIDMDASILLSSTVQYSTVQSRELLYLSFYLIFWPPVSCLFFLSLVFCPCLVFLSCLFRVLPWLVLACLVSGLAFNVSRQLS